MDAPAFNRLVPRRAAGAIFIFDPNGEQQYDTLQCVHCQAHWIPQPGSGRDRGWCHLCGGVTCGQRPCEVGCEPFEKAIEAIEANARFAATMDADIAERAPGR